MRDAIRVEGTDTLTRLLASVDRKHVKPLARAVLYGIAGEIRDKARALAPKRIGGTIKRNGKNKKPGNLKKMISAKNLKQRQGKSAAAIAYVKPDGYYWRFVEHGAKTKSGGNSRASRFLQRARASVEPRINAIMEEKFTKALQRRVQAELNRQARRTS